jgi:hypothetical protein
MSHLSFFGNAAAQACEAHFPSSAMMARHAKQDIDMYQLL